MRLTNPLHKSHCPFCNATFYLGECALVSDIIPGKVLRQPPRGTWNRFFSRIWLKPFLDPAYSDVLASPQCPRCQKPLPNANLSIVVLGSRLSGKRYYITALIHQLNELMQASNGHVQVKPINQEMEQRYRRYWFNPIFLNEHYIPSTSLARKSEIVQVPLIYELAIQRPRPNLYKCVNLLIYEFGISFRENLEYPESIAQHIFNASAIIFLIDPLEIPEIRKKIPQDLQDKFWDFRSFGTGLDALIYTFEKHGKLKPDSHIPTPLAIALSKSDLLRNALRPDQQYTFLHDSSYLQGMNLKDWQTVNNEVNELIMQAKEASSLHIIKEVFTNTSLFAVTATGNPPNKDGTFPALVPSRCLDPVFWILWQLGIISV